MDVCISLRRIWLYRHLFFPEGTRSDCLTFRCLYYRHLYFIRSILLIWFLLDSKDGLRFVYIFGVCMLIPDSVTWVDGSVLYSVSTNQVEVEEAKFKLLIKLVWKIRATSSESVDCMGLNCKVSYQHLYKQPHLVVFSRGDPIYALVV